jgi:hypothetical protein
MNKQNLFILNQTTHNRIEKNPHPKKQHLELPPQGSDEIIELHPFLFSREIHFNHNFLFWQFEFHEFL